MAFWKRIHDCPHVMPQARFEIDIESKWAYSHIKLSFSIRYILF